MRNELAKVVAGLGLEESRIRTLDYALASTGSPYDEVIKVENRLVTVNPYIRFGKLLEGLLCDQAFLNSAEGKLLFQEAMGLLLDIERYEGFDYNAFLKRLVEKELLAKAFGEDIFQFYQRLTVEEQKRTLENIVAFYRSEQTIDSFVKEVIALFPQSMLFQQKDAPKHIYLYMGTPKAREKQWKIERCKELFLDMDIQLHIAWEEAFLLTDLQSLELIGKCIV